MLTKEKIISELEKSKKQIQNMGVTKLTLFGSYATDNANENSDIDFLVEFKEGRGLFDDFIQLHQFLEDLFHKKIDLGEPDLIKEEIKKSILEGQQIEARI